MKYGHFSGREGYGFYSNVGHASLLLIIKGIINNHFQYGLPLGWS